MSGPEKLHDAGARAQRRAQSNLIIETKLVKLSYAIAICIIRMAALEVWTT